MSALSFFSFSFIQARLSYQVGKKKRNGCARGWCVRKGSLLQDRPPVKFNDPKFKHEIFMRIDMKHSYFSIFSVVEIMIELFVVCQKLIHVYA